MLNVVIPIYNSLDILPNCLDSLVCQTKKMFQTTIVQDGDGLDYSEIIKEYRHRGLHINFISLKENVGPGVARQKGVDAMPMCDYVTFLDSDDLFMPRAVEILYTEAKKAGADVIASPFIIEENGGPGIVTEIDKSITWLHGKIYSTRYLKKINLIFPDEYRDNEDAYFNLVAWNCTPNKGKIDEVTYIWRNNSNSLTRSNTESQYFLKTSSKFILSQIDGLEKVNEILGEVNYILVHSVLINIYQSMMVQKHFGMTEEDKYMNKLKIFLEKDYIKNCITNEQSWRVLASRMPGAQVLKDSIVFFDEPFDKWLKNIK